MRLVRTSVLIAARTDLVFDLARDVHVHVRGLAHTRVRAVAPGVTRGPVEVGDLVSLRAWHLGLPWRYDVRVAACEPPSRLVVVQEAGPLRAMRLDTRLTQTGAGTLLLDELSWRGGPWPVGPVVDAMLLRRYLRHLLLVRNAYLRMVAEQHATDPEPAHPQPHTVVHIPAQPPSPAPLTAEDSKAGGPPGRGSVGLPAAGASGPGVTGSGAAVREASGHGTALPEAAGPDAPVPGRGGPGAAVPGLGGPGAVLPEANGSGSVLAGSGGRGTVVSEPRGPGAGGLGAPPDAAPGVTYGAPATVPVPERGAVQGAVGGTVQRAAPAPGVPATAAEPGAGSGAETTDDTGGAGTGRADSRGAATRPADTRQAETRPDSGRADDSREPDRPLPCVPGGDHPTAPGAPGEEASDVPARREAAGQRPPLVVVAVALLDADGRVLAAERRGGGWELPGGKVEPGETPESALLRECREELGVEIVLTGRLPGRVPIAPNRPGARPAVLLAWTGRVVRGEPEPSVHARLRWLARDQLGDVEWLPADRPFVERLAAGHRPDG